MASSSDDKTTIKVIPFDPEDYKKWSHLVTSKAIAHKFGKVFFSKVFEDFKITPEEYYSEQVTDPAGQTVSITKEEKENFELNAKAWSYLEESVKDDPVAYGLLSVIENRNAHKAWRALKTKYDKTGDAIDMTTLENEWNEAKMNNDLEDPDIWFNELERIRGLIKEVAPAIQKNDTVMALKISSNLPHCYIPVYTNLTQVKKQGDLDTVKETVRAHYKAFIKNKTAEELAFINYTPHKERKKYQNRGRGGGQRPKNEETNGKGPWCDFCKRDTHNTDQCYSKDPKCFNCGKSGHLKKDCWAQGGGAYKEQANAASKDDVPCLICNKTGHKAADCSKNKDKEKDKKKSISFAGSAHVANELGVDGKEDIWLVDSGARVHITNDKSGLYNIKRTKTDVIVGDGWTSISPMKGDLRLITDKGYDLILRNVLFIPGFDKNLLSAMKLVENNNQIILDSPDSGYIKQMNSDHSILLTRGEHNMLYLNAFRTLPKTANQATISHDKPSTHTSPLNLQRNPFLSGVVTDDEESDDDDYDNDQPQDQIPRNETYRDVLLKQPKPKHMNANDAHRKFGHCSPNEMKTLAKILNIKLTGKLDPCPACLMAKSQQSRTRKQTINHKPEPGELLGIDLTGPFPPDIHQNKYVAVACDDATRHSWSKPIKTKTELKGFAEELLQKVKKKGITVERIRCDNAPENKKHLLPLCQQNNISLELTAPHTPQFNGKTERCITELWKNTKAVLTAARFTYQYKCDLWSYAWKYVEDTKSPTKNGALFVGKERQQRILSDPIEFGRLGTVDTGKKTKKSMSNRGERVIMIGYGGHTNASDTYLLLKPRTRQIVISRDVKWERWHGLENSSAPILEDIFEPNNDQEDSLLAEESSLPMMADDIRATMRDHPEIMDMDLESVISFEDGVLLDVFDLSDVEESSDDEVNDHLTQGNNIFRSDDASFDSSSDSEFPMEKETVGNGIETENPNENVSNEASRPAKLIDLDNPDVYEGRTRLQQRALDEDQGDIQNRAHFIHSRTTQDINQHRKRIKSETACNAISCDPGTPSSWKELWNNPELRKKWRDSACNEIENFLRRDAWKLFPRKDLNGRKPIGSKYVFKEKLEQDGSTRLKTRIVIKGYTQIPGIDFTETFSPVANDTSIRVAVSYALYKANWIPHVIDIEAAFLEADLDEVIVAEWPEGLKD
jgi:Arginine methyltransferase-interacting protein, contains RING Zn-finger